MKRILPAVAAAALSLGTSLAEAQIAITEVAPWSSGNSPVAADWFELTNFGTAAADISGWRMNDDTATFASAVALRGVTSIAAGKSVVFIESNAAGTTDSALASAFVDNWFGGVAPAGLQIGFYGGSGIGLGTGGDAVTIFDGIGAQRAKVSFGDSTEEPNLASFDNAAGLDNVTVSQLSAVGVNGASSVANNLGNTEVGSPGVIAAVPEPETYALFLAGLGLVGAIVRRRRR
jgi:hypothetical protein